MYINFSPNLFLGSNELIKFKESLDNYGFRLSLINQINKFGLLYNQNNYIWDNGLVELSSVGKIKHKDILAIDLNGNFITKPAAIEIEIPDDNAWYWVKIKYQE